MKLISSRLEIIPLNLKQMKLLLQGTPYLENDLHLNPSGQELDSHTHYAMNYIYELAGKTSGFYPWISNWQIILKSERLSIGSACFMNVPDKSGSVEVGYGIYPEYQRKGYMTEALKTICSWALDRENVKRITAQSEPENISSLRVLEKCGFHKKSEILWERFQMNI